MQLQNKLIFLNRKSSETNITKKLISDDYINFHQISQLSKLIYVN